MEDDDRYTAVSSRDGRFDGTFVTAVLTTRIYCRPSCPARTPLRRNVCFYAEAAAAEEAGFRACKRCRPQLAPDAPDVDVRGDLVGRALRLLADGAADGVAEVGGAGVTGIAGVAGIAGIARRLHVSERHLHRVFVAELGVGPQAVARSRRLRLARALLETSSLPAGDVAFASGFASVRQFNDAVRAGTGATPTELRAQAPGRREPGLALRLRFRAPYDTDAALRWVAAHAVPGVEEITPEGYRRVVDGGTLELLPRPDHWLMRLVNDDPRATGRLARAARRMLDLDADPDAVAAVLDPDPVLGPLVRKRPGLRCVGAFDAWESLARIVIGQQISVKGARTMCARFVVAAGTPLAAPSGTLTHAFPTPAQTLAADLSPVGLTGARIRTLQALAAAIVGGDVVLDGSVPAAEALAALDRVYGIGPWTLAYAAMRVLRDPDAWPAGDLILRRACVERGLDPDTDNHRWSPWRAYAATHLWEEQWF